MNNFLKLSLICLLPVLSLHADEPAFSFTATATGVDDSTPLEFILITPDSGHDYESIAISSLSAQAIKDGIAALGAVPGYPADFKSLKFWPKGEWLSIDVSYERDGESMTLPIGDLVWNTASNQSLKDDDWTFCGSLLMEQDGEQTLAADAREPGSIISVYNDPETLMDRSVQAPKGAVYGSLIVNTNLQLLEGVELTISIRRKSTNTTFQARDVPILVEHNDRGFVYTLRTPTGHEEILRGVFDELTTRLTALQKDFPNLYVNLMPGNDLPLAKVSAIYSAATTIEDTHRLRLSPPMRPHFFFQSFLPDPAFRDPAQRPSQPWELHIQDTNQTRSLTLVRYLVEERDLQGEPTLKEERIEIKTPNEMAGHLALGRYDLPVLLVFAPASLPYGDLIKILAPIRDSYDTFYFYIEQ